LVGLISTRFQQKGPFSGIVGKAIVSTQTSTSFNFLDRNMVVCHIKIVLFKT